MSEQAKQAAAPAGQQPTEGSVSEHLKAAGAATLSPMGMGAREDIKNAVRTLAEQALSSTSLITDDAIKSIQAMIAAIDAKLTEQVNEIIHNEAFRTLEGTWRGLHYLVNNTETDETLKIRVMNISKKDLGKTLKKLARAWHGTTKPAVQAGIRRGIRHDWRGLLLRLALVGDRLPV